ncbi:hypothetical protein N7451_012628 [Penicillium sp. IBT 35674x]|nr:hypothetical protein N7451_012628 [Penicillium sp. IBT 35674x]
MAFSVRGKTAVVTGAGSGINFCFAQLLLENGCNCLVADLALRPEAQSLITEHSVQSQGSGRAVFQKTDVTDWAQLEAMFVVAEEIFGEIDIVCPGAGIYEPSWSNFWKPPGSTESSDSPTGGGYAVIDINLVHPIRTTQLAISRFLKAKSPKHILHISSIAGQYTTLAVPMYGATKHALNGFVRSLAELDQEIGVRVTAIAPGIIKTPLWTEDAEKMEIIGSEDHDWVTPEQVASVMLAVIQQDKVCQSIGGLGDPTIPIKGGTILEVSKTNREVMPFNDPGPGARAGNTVAGMSSAVNKVWDLLGRDGWGKLPELK